MDEVKAGTVTEDELDATLDNDELAFGNRMPAHERAAIKNASIVDRVVGSRDGDDLVGVAVSVPALMTLPGLVSEPVAAVVGVAVRPTHRRQGRLRSMMRYQLDDLRERGHHLAVLTSSESSIYQRFGYGPATIACGYALDKRDLRVVEAPEDLSAGRVRFVGRDYAGRQFPEVFAAYQATRAGEVSRLAPGWAVIFGRAAEEDQRDRFFVEYEQDGAVLGYAAYRIVVDASGFRKRSVQVVELCARTPASYVALWSFLVDIDLVPTLEAHGRPVDEPIRWALSDYRRMSTLWTCEHTYVRLIDVGRALEARRYHDAGDLTIAVVDPFCPDNSGTYRLSIADPDGAATVEQTSARPDLELDVSMLASIYLGGLQPSALAETGLITAVSEGALARADRLFVGHRPPFCTTRF
ncbi:MAG: GNAT family N-acetyltransferase [Acidimicrobiales bacterium]|jgi:predicted acetyltransferase